MRRDDALYHPIMLVTLTSYFLLGLIWIKGKAVLVPVLCSMTFGAPLHPMTGGEHHDFLDRA